jgi:predicted nucleic acid-binding protein
MRHSETVFVDTGAWIALAITQDPYHAAAIEQWDLLSKHNAKLWTSVPIMIETFTFLQRNTDLLTALEWKARAKSEIGNRLLECTEVDLETAWKYFNERKFHKLSAVDATSFALMKRNKIKRAFTFDHHFAMAGFKTVV